MFFNINIYILIIHITSIKINLKLIMYPKFIKINDKYININEISNVICNYSVTGKITYCIHLTNDTKHDIFKLPSTHLPTDNDFIVFEKWLKSSVYN